MLNMGVIFHLNSLEFKYVPIKVRNHLIQDDMWQ